MEVKIVRGYKLKLWKDRLNLAPEFIQNVDLTGLNYVHLEYREQDTTTVILFTKMRGSKTPIPVMMRLPHQMLEDISERIEIGNPVEDRFKRTTSTRTSV